MAASRRARKGEAEADPIDRPGLLSSLRYPNFALLCSGYLISQLGSNMLTAVLAWHIYELTDSALLLGLTGLFRAIPLMAFSLVGGLVADSVDRRKLLTLNQLLVLLLAAWLAGLASLDLVKPWHIYAFTLLTAAIGAFDSPARQAIIPSLLPQSRLGEAITLFISTRKASTIIGPFLGGMAIASIGIAGGYWIAVGCFVGNLVALGALRLGEVLAKPRGKVTLTALVEGARFVVASPLIWALLLADFTVMLLGNTRGVLPIFARDVLEVGAEGFALLGSAGALGALIGLALALHWANVRRRGLLVMVATLGYALSVAAFGLAGSMMVALLALMVGGILDTVGETTRDTLLLTETRDELRGRVNSFANVFTQGGPFLGQFWVGAQVSLLGPQGGVVLGGGLIILTVLALTARVPALLSYGRAAPVKAA